MIVESKHIGGEVISQLDPTCYQMLIHAVTGELQFELRMYGLKGDDLFNGEKQWKTKSSKEQCSD